MQGIEEIEEKRKSSMRRKKIKLGLTGSFFFIELLPFLAVTAHFIFMDTLSP
jgi:hypothetical protein